MTDHVSFFNVAVVNLFYKCILWRDGSVRDDENIRVVK